MSAPVARLTGALDILGQLREGHLKREAYSQKTEWVMCHSPALLRVYQQQPWSSNHSHCYCTQSMSTAVSARCTPYLVSQAARCEVGRLREHKQPIRSVADSHIGGPWAEEGAHYWEDNSTK